MPDTTPPTDDHDDDFDDLDDEVRRNRRRRIAALIALPAIALLLAGLVTLAWWVSNRAPAPMAADDDSVSDGGEAAAADPSAPPALVDIANLPPTVNLEGARAARVSHHWVDEAGTPIALAKVLLADGRHTYCRLGGRPVAPVQCLNQAWVVDEWTEGTAQVLVVQEAPQEEGVVEIAREGDVAATQAADGTITIASDAAASPAAAPAPPTGS